MPLAKYDHICGSVSVLPRTDYTDFNSEKLRKNSNFHVQRRIQEWSVIEHVVACSQNTRNLTNDKIFLVSENVFWKIQFLTHPVTLWSLEYYILSILSKSKCLQKKCWSTLLVVNFWNILKWKSGEVPTIVLWNIFVLMILFNFV